MRPEALVETRRADTFAEQLTSIETNSERTTSGRGECELCGRLVRSQDESGTVRWRWLCAPCVAEQYTDWATEMIDEVLRQEPA